MTLTPTESRLLYALAANLGQTVTTETLLARGWADTEDADPSYVWVTMRRLRQKVELDAEQARPPAHGAGHRLPARERRRARRVVTERPDGTTEDGGPPAPAQIVRHVSAGPASASAPG